MLANLSFSSRSSATATNRRRAGLLTVAILALVALGSGAGAGTAAASAPIEGIWSFSGGSVAIQAQPDGSFVGTVVAPTKFSDCYHPAGEHVWTKIEPQANGSYWGLHQWYFATSQCIPNPELGLTAWRVLEAGDGSRILRVCFSEPGSKSQPTIAADGTSAGATFSCSDSARISALPAVQPAEAEKYIALPANGSCFGRRKMRIRLRNPAGDPLAKVVVRLQGGKFHTRAKVKPQGDGVIATLDLKGLTTNTFQVTVRLTTVLGAHLSAKRTYRRCGSPHRRHRSQ